MFFFFFVFSSCPTQCNTDNVCIFGVSMLRRYYPSKFSFRFHFFKAINVLSFWSCHSFTLGVSKYSKLYHLTSSSRLYNLARRTWRPFLSCMHEFKLQSKMYV
ncbi:hypothetical protein M6B38_195405 [Iris pallida]|uniref:Secreted protein n=1 Tax=Iris pallida TaxID=29817 RepID=A0AAX6EEA8_IRIPA|nr:hypothetical protein M6B38_195405 [Iris pallida]